MKHLLLLISTLAHLHISTLTFAQTTFQKTFGGAAYFDEGYAVQQTTDSGYIVAGRTLSFGAGNYDVYVIKTDANGDTLWTRTYGGWSNDYGYAVQQTTDGGYIVAGYTLSFGAGSSDVYLIKTDANGDTLWTKTYGGTNGEEGLAVQQTIDGGYIVAGYTGNFGAGSNDMYLIKTDVNGDTLWTRTYGGGGNDYGYAVQQTTDGGYIVAGYTLSFGAGSSDVYLIKTDANGDTLWTKTYGGGVTDYGYAVRQTTDGGYIVSGSTESFGAGWTDVYLIKTDVNGDTLWTKTYGGGVTDYGYAVEQTIDGGYIVAGLTLSFGAGNFDVYLIKTDVNGDTLWTRTYGGGGSDNSRVVDQTTDGGYIVTGLIFSGGWYDMYLIKTDSNGNSGCNQFNTTTSVSGGAIVNSTATIVGSGAIVNSTSTVVNSTATIDLILCVPPVANFIASDSIICRGDCINFTDLSTGFPTSWQWSFSGVTLSSSTTQNPTNICYNDTGTFDVQLIATNVNSLDTITINSFIIAAQCDTTELDTLLFLPNSFTPNGDGDNDIIYVRGNGINSIKFSIYNRWGQKVFETNNINEGWDGTYKGKTLNSGVYVWYAEVEFVDSSKIYRKGNVTLIR